MLEETVVCLTVGVPQQGGGVPEHYDRLIEGVGFPQSGGYRLTEAKYLVFECSTREYTWYIYLVATRVLT